jgi:hypothetical protein
MLKHSDRRQNALAPRRWAKSGPPHAVGVFTLLTSAAACLQQCLSNSAQMSR